VGNGGRWTSTLNVDNYLKQGSGLYYVTGTVTPGQGAWRCSGDFYVNLKGAKTIAIVGGVVTALGFGGVAASGRAPEPSASDADVQNASPSAEDVKKDFGNTVDDIIGIKKDPVVNTGANLGAGGCVWAAEELLSEMFGGIIGSGAGAFLLTWPLLTAAPDDDTNTKRIWRKGHPVLGFFSGLIFGLGLAITLQQLGHWTLNVGTVVAGPVLAAIVGAIRGRRGTAFKVTYREGPASPSAETVANA
jgi:hypothetical protein